MTNMDRLNDTTSPSRRSYLKWLGVGGLATLAGCSGSEPTDNATTTETGSDGTTDSSEITRGGTLRITVPQELKNLHPLKGVSATDYAFSEMMYSRLTVLHPDDTTAQPELATDWEPNDDMTAWTFFLNEDAVWPSGDPVTASDVEATVDLMMHGEDLPTADRFLGDATGADVVDEKTVRINLDSPDTEYPRRIVETGSTFNIIPKDIIENRYDELSETDFGSGPFQFTELQGGDKYVFEARDDYYGVDNNGNRIPYVDTLVAEIVSDPLAKANGLIDLRYDGLLQGDQRFESRYEQSDHSNLYNHNSMQLINVLLNVEHEPFDNPNVRKALKYAIGQDEMLAAIPGGSLGYHHSVSQMHKFFADDIDDPFTREAKPEKARELLEEEGYSGDPLLELPTLTFSKESNPQKEPQAQIFQQQMRAAGIEFDLQLITTDTWLTEYWNKDEPWYFSAWAARAVESSILELAFHSESSWNSARYNNSEYDQHLEAAMSATDMGTKREELKQCQQILHLDGPWLVTTFIDMWSAWNDYVKDVELPFTTERSYYHDAWLTEEAPKGP